MNLDNAIFLPAIGMVLLTLIVWLRMYTDRVGELRSKKIHPQQVATARKMGEVLENVQSADHFRNLFEMPVLFYVLCGFLAITKLTTLVLLAMAWGYVFLRALHAYTHLTSNRVIRRFQIYAASCIVLWVMWGVFAVLLLMRR
jgi:hypothetical protein